MSINILLADDHKIIRDGLRTLLDRHPKMNVIAEAADGRSTIRLAKELSPDITIMDITMPDLNGIDASKQILKNDPDARIIALSVHTDKRYVKGMLHAGVLGYLSKDCSFDELVQAINTVMNYEVFLSPKIATIAVKDYMRQKELKPDPSTDLTAREREVLQLLAEGKNIKQIASDLDLSRKTIESHRQRIMNKLSIYDTAGLVKFALREGLTSLEL